MKIPAAISYAPFFLFICGGVIGIMESPACLKIPYTLLITAGFLSLAASITGRTTRHRLVAYVFMIASSIIFSYYLIEYISWSTGGKPGTIFYSGANKFYHVANAYLSLSIIFSLVPCWFFRSDFEVFFESLCNTKAKANFLYGFVIFLAIISSAIWYSYLNLPVHEFG